MRRADACRTGSPAPDSAMQRASKLYHCTICGAVLPNEPKPVLEHQMSHVRRRPYATSAPDQPKLADDQAEAPEWKLATACHVAPTSCLS